MLHYWGGWHCYCKVLNNRYLNQSTRDSPIAEPHSHHLLLHTEVISKHRYLLWCRLGVLQERFLQGHPHTGLNRRPLLSPPSDGFRCRQRIAQTARVGCRRICVGQPLLEQRLELAHVLEGEVESLEPGDGGLGEVVPVQLAHSEANITLSETWNNRNEEI